MLNAVPVCRRAGYASRGLPQLFGNLATVALVTRMNRWAKNGMLDRVFVGQAGQRPFASGHQRASRPVGLDQHACRRLWAVSRSRRWHNKRVQKYTAPEAIAAIVDGGWATSCIWRDRESADGARNGSPFALAREPARTRSAPIFPTATLLPHMHIWDPHARRPRRRAVSSFIQIRSTGPWRPATSR